VLESTVQTGLKNEANTIAMARTSDPDSATAGFFVNTGANTGFNSTTTRDGYAVFGQVVHGTSAWSSLLTTAVPGSGEVQNPASPLWLRWAYQIQ
jgi:cyclophilin family peptidyl-prolyl cis-trans isomerase